MQNGIAAAWILITLPFVGVVFAFIRMHHAVYNAETPTKKNQLMVLQLLVMSNLCYGLAEAFSLLYSHGKSLSVLLALCIGSLGLVSAVTGGLLISKQLALGFMHHVERFHKALIQQALVSIFPILGLVLFFVLAIL